MVAAKIWNATEVVGETSCYEGGGRGPAILSSALIGDTSLSRDFLWIAAEGRAFLKYHDGIGVQTLVGGTRFKDDQKRLESESHERINREYSCLMGLKMLIIDEADHLLDLGFLKDMEEIIDCLPCPGQSLLYSAAMPKEVCRISQLVLKSKHAFIDTAGDRHVETHAQVLSQAVDVATVMLTVTMSGHIGVHFQVVHFLEHILETPEYKGW
ncbi:probable DEAD-box ATP-dependent RNA helicase 48 [Eucalyptus grandis]|uniref:probable DEAD-box ATP-dependent RNA helicase 48 n=1 Tax=Eucalyptus grandis TaxID=71139 RepID=UPI00192EC857|nr:probable DEAD-box ATP-dependent RNA helicase 48 [Eucalyptus grandis]